MENPNVLITDIAGTTLCVGFNHTPTVGKKAILNSDVIGRGDFAIKFYCGTTIYRSPVLAVYCVNATVANRYVTAFGEVESILICSDVDVVYQHAIALHHKDGRIATVMDIQVSDFYILAVS